MRRIARRTSTFRRLEVGDQAPLEAGNQAFLEVLDLAGGTVAGEDNLPVPLVEGVKSVEELFLDALFARQELNVIDQQNVGLAVFLAKFRQLVVLNAVDVLIGELFRSQIGHARPLGVGAGPATC